MFNLVTSIESIDFYNFNTSKVKNMKFMFFQCTSLKKIDLSGFDTSNVTNMWSMFGYCNSLKTLDLSSFDTSKTENMESMFYGCISLSSLPEISKWNTSNVKNMSNMFHVSGHLAEEWYVGDLSTKEITKPDGTEIYTKARATIYGEVWYKIDIEYPYAYKEEKLTGKSKETYVINFLNKKIPMFSYNKYKKFQMYTNTIIENNILPISLSKEKMHEVIVKEAIYTWEEAVSNAIEVSKKKLLDNNNKIINIKQIEILDKQTIGSKIKLNLFISVEEDITKVAEVKKIEENQGEKDLQN